MHQTNSGQLEMHIHMRVIHLFWVHIYTSNAVSISPIKELCETAASPTTRDLVRLDPFMVVQVSCGSREEGARLEHVPPWPHHLPTPHQGQEEEKVWRGDPQDREAMGRCVGQPQGGGGGRDFGLQEGELHRLECVLKVFF